jgi:patatin-like phospholipase/acyl hydrolase
MESYAYMYSMQKGYTFPRYPGREDVIAMKDLFDMMAGTSTGSIISAALSYPSDDVLATGEQVPQYWSKEVIEVYSQRGGEIFQKK